MVSVQSVDMCGIITCAALFLSFHNQLSCTIVASYGLDLLILFYNFDAEGWKNVKRGALTEKF